MLFQAFKGLWTVYRILDSHPHGMAGHLPGHLEGPDALTRHQGAYGFCKRMNLSGDFPSYRTFLHEESPPFLRDLSKTSSSVSAPLSKEVARSARKVLIYMHFCELVNKISPNPPFTRQRTLGGKGGFFLLRVHWDSALTPP